MKKTNIYKTILGILIILCLYWFFYGRYSDERSLIKKGNEVIYKIEAYRLENNVLPDSLSKLGIIEDESGPVFYKKIDEGSYEVFFSIGFDYSRVYNSISKKWEEEYQ